MDSPDFNFKILLLGDSEIGMPQLLYRVIENTWSPSPVFKSRTDFRLKLLTVDDNSIRLSIWDSAGRDGFYLTNTYFRGAHGVIFLYSRYDLGSFRHLTDWIDRVARLNSSPNIIKMILAHDYRKAPEDPLCVTEEDGAALARDHDALHFIVNSENGQNVDECITALIRQLIASARSAAPAAPSSPSANPTIRLDKPSPSSTPASGGCCS